jgi:hypothetical protein
MGMAEKSASSDAKEGSEVHETHGRYDVRHKQI